MSLVRIKDISNSVRRGLSPNYADDGLNILNQSCVRGDVVDFSKSKIFNNPSERGLVRKGDSLINSTGTGTLGRVSIYDETEHGYIDSHITKVSPNKKIINPDYLHLFLMQDEINRYFNVMSEGATNQIELSRSTVDLLCLSLPSLDCQTDISLKVKSKLNTISSSIAILKQKLIHLDEYKTALIHNAVTKGLDANGCRILDGEENSEFETVRVQDFSVERSVKVNDTDYAPLSVTKNGIVPRMEGVATTIHNDNRKQVISGDFVINSRADRKGSSGISPLTGSVSVISTVLNLNDKVDRKYGHYLFRGNDFIEKYFMAGKGIVLDLWSTNSSAMKKISIKLPVIEEQIEIGNYLDIKTKTVERNLMSINKKIALLIEYKKSLINEAVSGEVVNNTLGAESLQHED